MNKRHTEKMKRKRAEKAAKRAKYAALAGTSKKGKRQRKKSDGPASPFKGAHLMSNCGNPGCKKCHHLLVIRHNRATPKIETEGDKIVVSIVKEKS